MPHERAAGDDDGRDTRRCSASLRPQQLRMRRALRRVSRLQPCVDGRQLVFVRAERAQHGAHLRTRAMRGSKDSGGKAAPAGGTGKLKRTEEEGAAPSGATRPEQPRRSRAAEIAAWNSEPRGIRPMQMPWAARSCALEGSGGRLLSRPCAQTPAVRAAPARSPRAALPRARAPPTA